MDFSEKTPSSEPDTSTLSTGRVWQGSRDKLWLVQEKGPSDQKKGSEPYWGPSDSRKMLWKRKPLFSKRPLFPNPIPGSRIKGERTMKCKLWTETLEFSRLKVPNSLSALHGLAALHGFALHGLCAFFASNSRFMRLFQAALDTCLDSPFFASLSVHGLLFTVYAPSIESCPQLSRNVVPAWGCLPCRSCGGKMFVPTWVQEPLNRPFLNGLFQVQACLVTERALSWQMHLSLVLKAFGSLISFMSWEWTNRNAANRHLELPAFLNGQFSRGFSGGKTAH